MIWHRGHGMGHMWAPKDSPAAGATRYGHGLARRRTREMTGRRSKLWPYISGKFVELMSWKFQESSSSRDGDIIPPRVSPKVLLGWLATACSEACLAVYLHENLFCVKSTRCPRDGTPVFGSSCAVPPQKSVGSFSVRVSCSVAWKFSMDTNGLEWNERPPRVVSFHSNRSNPVETIQ